ncbi:hypothetical protein FHT71_003584 [Rhizobium sp. BK060]|nr:hypothetical protein [Rhizobium sp. BK060]
MVRQSFLSLCLSRLNDAPPQPIEVRDDVNKFPVIRVYIVHGEGGGQARNDLGCH